MHSLDNVESCASIFLLWGILLSVFLVRAGLPFLIVYSIRPEAGIMGVFAGIFNEDPSLASAIESSAPPLLAAGGTFLVFLFPTGSS